MWWSDYDGEAEGQEESDEKGAQDTGISLDLQEKMGHCFLALPMRMLLQAQFDCRIRFNER